jgi:hypothetical protein
LFLPPTREIHYDRNGLFYVISGALKQNSS